MAACFLDVGAVEDGQAPKPQTACVDHRIYIILSTEGVPLASCVPGANSLQCQSLGRGRRNAFYSDAAGCWHHLHTLQSHPLHLQKP
jgi:hypothetical protein